MSWDHGYYSHGSYTSGYFQETAPNWIDFATLMKGVAPPRGYEGVPFRYLDLGCGTGFGLCLLAALYPEGEFLGVDFLPLHVAKAEALATQLELKNIRFLEADFLALAKDVSPVNEKGCESPRYDYVVSHGVATWVVEPVQRALFAVAAACLRPGGIFYCSYNCFPGWLGRTALHELVGIEQRRNDPSQPQLPIRNAVATLKSLLGNESTPANLAKALPLLSQELAALDKHNPQYLSQEYANEGWQPLYVHELHHRCKEHKLSHVSTATLSELFRNLLPPLLQEAIKSETNSTVKELMVDLATYKSFRRDLFALGPLHITRADLEQRVGKLRVRLQETPPLQDYVFSASYGKVNGNLEAYRAVEEALADGPQTLASLMEVCSIDIEQLAIQVALLLHGGRLGLERGEAGERSLEMCNRINQILLTRTREGLGHHERVTVPTVGQAITLPLRDQLIMAGLDHKLSINDITKNMQTTLSNLGLPVARDGENRPVEGSEDQLHHLEHEVREFRQNRLSRLQEMGIQINPS